MFRLLFVYKNNLRKMGKVRKINRIDLSIYDMVFPTDLLGKRQYNVLHTSN